jgi:LAO/AO transport system kinase
VSAAAQGSVSDPRDAPPRSEGGGAGSGPRDASGGGAQPPDDAAGTIRAVRAGERRAIARTITLLESRRPDHVERGLEVLDALAAEPANGLRLGITGPPGVGKSSLIEALGSRILDLGHTLAVLAIDPTSPRSGGSILGDKTRMARLALDPRAFVRPSPSSGIAGGVAPRTREAILVCEAAGFDVVIVETVGVGQSEHEVAAMADFFMVLVQPGSGDELQGIKKGVLELADALVIHKADGELAALADRTRADHAAALRLLRPRSTAWSPPALCASAHTGTGLDALWKTVLRHREAMVASGEHAARRREQAILWLRRLLHDGLEALLRTHEGGLGERVAELERAVERLEITPPRAAQRVLRAFRQRLA